MPIREYHCERCNRTQDEVFALDHEPVSVECLWCGGVAMLEKWSAPAMVKIQGGTPRFHKRFDKATDIDHRPRMEAINKSKSQP